MIARRVAAAALLFAWLFGNAGVARPAGADWERRFAEEVDRRLDVPSEVRAHYITLLEGALESAGLLPLGPQALVLVDRSPRVQAAFVVLRTPELRWEWLGAVPVSTGRPGRFEHFVTPLGAFPHTPDHPDFRAEGTFNDQQVRGYGVKGMRIFDFGWVVAERGWGAGGTSLMRLQMHATDPARLEPRLGQAASKGCVRIPSAFNVFLDRYGVLDADYEAAAARGEPPKVLRSDRSPIPWPGRWLVVVDSRVAKRPAWAVPRSASRHTPGGSS